MYVIIIFVTGFCFQVVSSSHSIEDIHQAIFTFIDAAPSLLHTLSPEDYQNHVNTQISEKLRADPSLFAAASFNWYEITEGKTDFGLRVKQADDLKNPKSLLLQQKGLEQFTVDLLKSNRRLLVVHSELPSAAATSTSTSTPSASSTTSHTFGNMCGEMDVLRVKNGSEVHCHGSIVIPR